MTCQYIQHRKRSLFTCVYTLACQILRRATTYGFKPKTYGDFHDIQNPYRYRLGKRRTAQRLRIHDASSYCINRTSSRSLLRISRRLGHTR